MRYQGGKSLSAKGISAAIRERERESNTFVSLFCGSCAVEIKLASDFEQIICNDIHKYLIEMYRGLQGGFVPPEFVSKEEYRRIREHKDENPALAGAVGFGSSFGGRWFAGYARAKGRNCALETKHALERDKPTLLKMEFTCCDYRDVKIPHGAVVYADPPYKGTTGYSNKKFDTNEFWEYMRKISEYCFVYVSEQTAPNDFVCIWEKPVRRTLDVNKNNRFTVTEKLFVPCKQARKN